MKSWGRQEIIHSDFFKFHLPSRIVWIISMKKDLNMKFLHQSIEVTYAFVAGIYIPYLTQQNKI